jgi:hypothetical protein
LSGARTSALPGFEGIAYTSDVEMEDEMRQMPILQRSWTSAICSHVVFVTGLLLTVVVSSESVARSGFIVGLLAVSLPALVAWLYIESSGWMGPEPVVLAIAMTCSVVGFLLTIWSFSPRRIPGAHPDPALVPRHQRGGLHPRRGGARHVIPASRRAGDQTLRP